MLYVVAGVLFYCPKHEMKLGSSSTSSLWWDLKRARQMPGRQANKDGNEASSNQVNTMLILRHLPQLSSVGLAGQSLSCKKNPGLWEKKMSFCWPERVCTENPPKMLPGYKKTFTLSLRSSSALFFSCQPRSACSRD